MRRKIKCKICNKELRFITKHLYKVHLISREDYVKRYGEYHIKKSYTLEDKDSYTCKICNNVLSIGNFCRHLKLSHNISPQEYIKEYEDYIGKRKNKIISFTEKCMICSNTFSCKSFWIHLNKVHNLTPEQYILQTKYNNIRPTCKCGCGKYTRLYTHKRQFNEYYNGHNPPPILSKEHYIRVGEKHKQRWLTYTPEERENMMKKINRVSILETDIANLYSEFYDVQTQYIPKEIITIRKTDLNQKIFIYDIFIKELNLLIEVNGDYYHINPLHPKFKKMKNTDKIWNRTVKEIKNRDMEKKKFAISSGYHFLTIWESEYKNLKNTFFGP